MTSRSLFEGISPERIARLRSITIQGRPLFNEAGEVNDFDDEDDEKSGAGDRS